jgi:hypothetical protein
MSFIFSNNLFKDFLSIALIPMLLSASLAYSVTVSYKLEGKIKKVSYKTTPDRRETNFTLSGLGGHACPSMQFNFRRDNEERKKQVLLFIRLEGREWNFGPKYFRLSDSQQTLKNVKGTPSGRTPCGGVIVYVTNMGQNPYEYYTNEHGRCVPAERPSQSICRAGCSYCIAYKKDS